MIDNYYYMFVKNGKEFKDLDGDDGINLGFHFKRDNTLKRIILNKIFHDKISNSMKTEIPLTTCESKFVSQDLMGFEEIEKTAIALFNQKQAEQVAIAAARGGAIRSRQVTQQTPKIEIGKTGTQTTLISPRRNALLKTKKSLVNESSDENNNSSSKGKINITSEDIAKGAEVIKAGVNIIMAVKGMKQPGGVSADNINSIVDGVKALVPEKALGIKSEENGSFDDIYDF